MYSSLRRTDEEDQEQEAYLSPATSRERPRSCKQTVSDACWAVSFVGFHLLSMVLFAQFTLNAVIRLFIHPLDCQLSSSVLLLVYALSNLVATALLVSCQVGKYRLVVGDDQSGVLGWVLSAAKLGLFAVGVYQFGWDEDKNVSACVRSTWFEFHVVMLLNVVHVVLTGVLQRTCMLCAKRDELHHRVHTKNIHENPTTPVQRPIFVTERQSPYGDPR